MKKYKVNVTRVLGANNKTYVAGQEVTEDMFPEGNAEKLAKSGHLIEVSDKTEKKPEPEKVEVTDKAEKKSKSVKG